MVPPLVVTAVIKYRRHLGRDRLYQDYSMTSPAAWLWRGGIPPTMEGITLVRFRVGDSNMGGQTGKVNNW